MQSFGIIPAAGISRRMGTPKLLLPWRGKTIIEHVLAAWQLAGVTRTVIVVRPGDTALTRICDRLELELVVPSVPPPEMKISIREALEHVDRRYQPGISDVWLLAPADMPQLTAARIARMLVAHDPQQPSILVPTFQGRRGHPVLFPWARAAEVATLRDDEGVDKLLDRGPVRYLSCDDLSRLEDLDTPEDYERLRSDSSH